MTFHNSDALLERDSFRRRRANTKSKCVCSIFYIRADGSRGNGIMVDAYHFTQVPAPGMQIMR